MHGERNEVVVPLGGIGGVGGRVAMRCAGIGRINLRIGQHLRSDRRSHRSHAAPGQAGIPDLMFRNDHRRRPLSNMPEVEIAKPLFRAMRIYRRMARHDLDRGMRRDLARHIRRLAEQGEQDTGRLTVCGLSYLRELDRQRALERS
jgi:hypothetical protein